MKTKKIKFIIFAVFFFAVFLAPKISQAAGLERSGRWFKYNGSYPYFVGYDLQQLFANKSYSYADIDHKLDQLKEFRVNKIRVWANNWYMGTNAYYPWTVDASGKKNLDVWDATYWTRMKDFVQKCKDRGIIVEFTIFSPYPKDINGWWSDTNYKNAWNKNFNVNNAFSSNTSGNFWPQFFDLAYGEKSSSGKTLKDYQKALIDKSIDELKGYGNVYFEVANEFPGVWDNGNAINQVYPWQQYWADYMHNTKGAITTCHANEGSGQNTWGIQYFRDKSYVDILNFHFRTAVSDATNNAGQISNFLHGLQTAGKILQSNESKAYEESTYTDRDTREAWGTFASGGYYFHYQDTPDIIGDIAWRTNAERLKTLRNVAESVSFWQMSPVDSAGNEYDSLVSAGPASYWQVLANPGNEYVIYFSISPTSNNVSINLPGGNYNYKFYDTRTWNSNGVESGTVTSSGGSTSIPSPSTTSWNGSTGLALAIKKVSVTPPDTTSPAAPAGVAVN
jgi:hypothetical protein